MSEVIIDVADGILKITFNRPHKRNAISQTIMKAVISKLNETAKDDNVKIAVITGTGDFYSSGNDFNPSEDYEKGLTTFKDFVTALIDYPKLLVAVVNGPAIGVACTMLALCDIVYASQNTYFQTPFTLLGLLAECCSTYTFPRIFGNAQASKLLYLNEVMKVHEANSFGFVTQVFPHKKLETETTRLIKELASLPLQSLMLTKQLVRKWDRIMLHSANQEEVELLGMRLTSKDFLDAILNPETSKKIKSKL